MASVTLALGALTSAAVPSGPAGATPVPVSRAAPYLYLGWGSPPVPVAVMSTTGIRAFTLAFVLAGHGCVPTWDGKRPLLGGSDASSIAAIRAAGGDVSVSFGGWSGRKLGTACRSAAALAGAYEQVIDAYGLHAIDVDIEHGEFTNRTSRLRVVTALHLVQLADPAVEISVTFGTTPIGPDATGTSLLTDAAAVGFVPYAWTVMPFDFGVPEPDMGATSVAAAEGLHADLMSVSGMDSATAYAHMGISSMNGRTDEADETVSAADYRTMLAYAEAHHLARLTFWAVNRDRSCPSGTPAGDTCSGIVQADGLFTTLTAGYTG
ncbi:MAG TPA: chitinase [Acidimicrobiales bacterium]